MVDTPGKFVVGRLRTRRLDSRAAAVTNSELRRQLKQLDGIINDVFDQFERVTPDIMLATLQPTFAISQSRTPLQTGRLRSSGYLEVTDARRGSQRVEIGYAKAGDPSYAIFVHERVDIPHRPPTTAKFLQGPMLEDIPNIRKRLQEWYAGFISGGAL